MKKDNKNIIITVLLFIIIVLGGILGYVFILTDSKQVENNLNEVEDKTESKEETLNPKDYEYLYERLVNVGDIEKDEFITGCSTEKDFLREGSKNKLDNKYFMSVALGNLVSKKEYKEVKDEDSFARGSISEEKVKNQLKELYDSSISIKMGDTYAVIYEADEKTFYLDDDGLGCLIYDNYETAPIKAIKKGNILELTIAAGYTTGGRGETYKFYASEDTSRLVKEFKENEDIEHIDGLSLKDYIIKNADQFTQYKLTFKIDNDKYLFSKIEKIK